MSTRSSCRPRHIVRFRRPRRQIRNGSILKTTPIAFPEDVTASVYRTGVYASRGQNATRNANDNVFSDGVQYEMATLTGDATSGYVAVLTIGVSL